MKNLAMESQSVLRTRAASAAFVQDSPMNSKSFKSGFKEGSKMSSPINRGKNPLSQAFLSALNGFAHVAETLSCLKRTMTLVVTALFVSTVIGSAAAQMSGNTNYWLSNSNCGDIQNLKVSVHVTENMIAEWTGGSSSGPGFGIQLNANPIGGQIAPNGTAYTWLQYVIMIHNVGGQPQVQAMMEYWYDNTNYQYATYPSVADLPSYTISAGSVLSFQLTTDSNGNVTQIDFIVTAPNGTVQSYATPPTFIGESTPLLVKFDSFQVIIGGPWDSQYSTFSSGQGSITYSASNGALGVTSCTGIMPAESSNVYYSPMGPSVNSTVTQAFAWQGGAWGLSGLASEMDTADEKNEVYYLGSNSNLYQLSRTEDWQWREDTGGSGTPSVAPGSGTSAYVNTIYNGNEAFYVQNTNGNLHIEQLWGSNLSPTDLTETASGKPVAEGTSPAGYIDTSAETDNVFYIGTDSYVHHLNWSAGNPWTEDGTLDSTTTPAAAPGSPLVGHLRHPANTGASDEIFYIGSNQHVDELWSWAGQERWLTSDLTAASGGPVAAVGSPLAGFYDVAANVDAIFYIADVQTSQGSMPHVFELSFSSNGWQSIDLTAKTGAPAACVGSALAAHLNTLSGSEEVYFLDSNGNVHEFWTWSSAPTGWYANNVTAASGDAPLAFPESPLTTDISTLDNTDHVFYVGTDQNVHELWFNGTWHYADDNTQTSPVAPNAVP